MALDVPALRSSFQLVVERDPNITKRFYDILFDRYPQARSLFTRNSPAMQQRMFSQALSAVLDHLEDPEWLIDTLGAMGKRHEAYGANAEMYDWVGECLLVAISQVAGDDWTPELESAWTEAYGAIVSLMLAGADSTVTV